MKSLELPKMPDTARELVELESDTNELLAELDEVIKENKHLRELSSVALDALDETDERTAASPVENRSDAVQDAPTRRTVD